MLVLNVYYKVKPHQRSEYLAAVNAAGIPNCSRDEAGCLKYDFYCPPDREDELLLIEHYEDAAAFAHHKSTEHFATLQKIKAVYIESTQVTRMNAE